MRDFYASTGSTPLDQADGLRRMFAGAPDKCMIPLAANPYAACPAVVIERLTTVFGAAGRHTLLVDAADTSPAPAELARLDLAAAMEPLGRGVTYLAARGLPLAHVDTRGSAAGWLDAVVAAAPQADVVLVHAGPLELARMFQRRPCRPLVIGADHPESIKHAYAAVKLMAQRCSLLSFDLLLVAAPTSPRARHIVDSLAGCADGFLGSVLHAWALIDPASALDELPGDDLRRLVHGQLARRADPVLPPPAPAAHTAGPA
jgi:flagellar biosynthesis protein FlhG